MTTGRSHPFDHPAGASPALNGGACASRMVKGRLDDAPINRERVDTVLDDAWRALVAYDGDGQLPPP